MRILLSKTLRTELQRDFSATSHEVFARVNISVTRQTGQRPSSLDWLGAIGLIRKYDPSQPRNPPGQADGGQWA